MLLMLVLTNNMLLVLEEKLKFPQELNYDFIFFKFEYYFYKKYKYFIETIKLQNKIKFWINITFIIKFFFL